MSVNNVNSIYGPQAMQGTNGYTVNANEDEGSGIDIGKLLIGGAAIATTVGLGIAAYKTGKGSSLAKEGDNTLQTIWNGVKSWFGKNGDDVSKVMKTVKEGDVVSMEDAQQTLKNINTSTQKALNHQASIDNLLETISTNDHKLDSNDLEKFKSILKKLDLKDEDIKLDNEKFTLTENAKNKLSEWLQKHHSSTSTTSTSLGDTLDLKTLKTYLGDTSSYYQEKAAKYTADSNALSTLLNQNNGSSHITSDSFADYRKYIDNEADYQDMLYNPSSYYFKDNNYGLLQARAKDKFGDDYAKITGELTPGGSIPSPTPVSTVHHV